MMNDYIEFSLDVPKGKIFRDVGKEKLVTVSALGLTYAIA